MVDRFDINNVDAATKGITFLEGIYDELDKIPEPKDTLLNDWPDQHGKERDVTARFWKSTQMSVHILIKGNTRAEFVANRQWLKGILVAGYFNLKCHGINRQFNLVITGVGSQKYYGNIGEVTLLLEDDFPQLITPIV